MKLGVTALNDWRRYLTESVNGRTFPLSSFQKEHSQELNADHIQFDCNGK